MLHRMIEKTVGAFDRFTARHVEIFSEWFGRCTGKSNFFLCRVALVASFIGLLWMTVSGFIVDGVTLGTIFTIFIFFCYVSSFLFVGQLEKEVQAILSGEKEYVDPKVENGFNLMRTIRWFPLVTSAFPLVMSIFLLSPIGMSMVKEGLESQALALAWGAFVPITLFAFLFGMALYFLTVFTFPPLRKRRSRAWKEDLAKLKEVFFPLPSPQPFPVPAGE